MHAHAMSGSRRTYRLCGSVDTETGCANAAAAVSADSPEADTIVPGPRGLFTPRNFCCVVLRCLVGSVVPPFVSQKWMQLCSSRSCISTGLPAQG